MSSYPSAIDQFLDKVDLTSPQSAADVNALQRAVMAAELELEDIWRPFHVGLLGWVCDPTLIASFSQPASGVLQIARVRKPGPQQISAAVLGIGVNGSGLAVGQCLVGIYNMAGVLIGQSGDQSAAWSAGAPTMKVAQLTAPISPAAAGDYYVGWYGVGTTMPNFYRPGGVASQAMNALQLGGLPIATTIAGSAVSLPQATITLASVAGLSIPSWVYIVNDAGQRQIVWFSGISGNQLTGCFGGSGTAQVGNAVTTPGSRGGSGPGSLTTALPATITPAGTYTGGQLWAGIA